MSKHTIVQFIQQFDKDKDTFLYGMCYWFAVILSSRFGGEIYYNDIDNHFATLIGNSLYDVTGELYNKSEFIPWEQYSPNSSERKRVIKYCILKEDC